MIQGGRAWGVGLGLWLVGLTLSVRAGERLLLAVTDPLAREHACACVAGLAQRDYRALARYLARRLQQPVETAFPEAAALASPAPSQRVADLVVGRKAEVEAVYAAAGERLTLLALLTDREGKTTQEGLFVVRQDDPAQWLPDLDGRRVLFGPPAVEETHSAALAALSQLGLPLPTTPQVRERAAGAAAAVLRDDADAAVISAYALPLLIGCDALGKDELRVLGRTALVPFIAVFATAHLPRALRLPVLNALQDAGKDPGLLRQLESRDGFVILPRLRPAAPSWADWRGSGARDGLSTTVPLHLPTTTRFAWRRQLSGQSLGGLAATARLVLVSDKSASLGEDVWRCLEAESGEPRWAVTYPVPLEMDFTSAPRATAVLASDAIYLLSAFGHLLCVDPADGRVQWQVDLLRQFGGTLPTWGFCGTPLLVDDLVVVQTTAEKAGLVALDRHTGTLRWRSPGGKPGYGSLMVGSFGGRRQIIGHDATSLGGWDPASGSRLWRVLPPTQGDFNVPTPVALGGLLLVATEGNGARVFNFSNDGTVRPQPVALAADFAPDTVTPVLVDGRVWGFNAGRFRCLDAASGLPPAWEWDGEDAGGHVSLIGGNGGVLAATNSGAVLLFPARPDRETQPERLQVFTADDGVSPEVWSQPALVGPRLYLRSRNEVVCLRLD